MGQTLCHFEGAGSKKEYICQFKEWWIISEIFSEDRGNWIPFCLHSLSIILICFIWILAYLPRNRDFTRSFIISLLIPLSITTLCRWIHALNQKLNFICQVYRCIEENNVILGYLQLGYATTESVLRRTSHFLFTSNAMIFLFMVAMMGKSKELKSGKKAWAPFLLVLVASILLGVIFQCFPSLNPTIHSVEINLPKTLYVIIFNSLVLLIIILCQRFSCFSTSQLDEEAEGITYLTQYKRSLRLGSIVFGLIFHFPILLSILVVDLFGSLGKFNGAKSEWLEHTLTLFEWITPFFFTLSTIFCIPRFKICCSDRRQFYVTKEEIVE